MLSIIIPAYNEASVIGRCLASVLAADDPGCPVEIIVSANACRDGTIERARANEAVARRRGWRLTVIDRPEPGKPGALNAGDAAARGDWRLYLDADVAIERDMLRALAGALRDPRPRFVGARLAMEVTSGDRFGRLYARLWARLPFMALTVPGCGLFAVNAAARARWGAFPDVLGDDIFVRLQFAPAERVAVAARYRWPVAAGFAALVRVRRRQRAAVTEIAARFPELARNEDKPPLGGRGLLRLALADPLGLAAYGLVGLAVRARRPEAGWSRAR
ncbi:glycosyltransferase family 2 protein [Amaricoccus solimangrovi]|uniref:Glycosyltransferase family 2 protein n=1 Tax=Amaricoccus solimangrovi TaxID=2589815 RepID=A0A501WN25_9RHOB|nr:glycosyltransferase family 2 protein [Amaricoccus solimangrovi]TPE49745.1 glycosyltransferase family 2 protein [Amaricoccus solimangrovi]